MASTNKAGKRLSSGRLDHFAMPSIASSVIVEVVAFETLVP
ncbi:hypothetical protein GA0115241_1133233 [Streptomyces sp. DpondAA-D4]|nr:hypothetical protein GA0115241_1133233 [Streptomyces sp. DpondAA-D4]